MPSLTCVLIDEAQRFSLLASYLHLATHNNALVLFATDQQIDFF